MNIRRAEIERYLRYTFSSGSPFGGEPLTVGVCLDEEEQLCSPQGISRKTRNINGVQRQDVNRDGVTIFRVRVWDPVLKKRTERLVAGLEEAKALMTDFTETKHSRPGRLQAERIRFVDVAAKYLVAYKTKRDGKPRPKSSVAKERTF